MADLPDEAKAAIAEAVRIVREDRFEAFVRGKMAPSKEPEGDPTNPPPPPKDEPPKPKKRKGIWWPSDESEEEEPPKPPEAAS